MVLVYQAILALVTLGILAVSVKYPNALVFLQIIAMYAIIGMVLVQDTTIVFAIRIILVCNVRLLFVIVLQQIKLLFAHLATVLVQEIIHVLAIWITLVLSVKYLSATILLPQITLFATIAMVHVPRQTPVYAMLASLGHNVTCPFALVRIVLMSMFAMQGVVVFYLILVSALPITLVQNVKHLFVTEFQQLPIQYAIIEMVRVSVLMHVFAMQIIPVPIVKYQSVIPNWPHQIKFATIEMVLV